MRVLFEGERLDASVMNDDVAGQESHLRLKKFRSTGLLEYTGTKH